MAMVISFVEMKQRRREQREKHCHYAKPGSATVHGEDSVVLKALSQQPPLTRVSASPKFSHLLFKFSSCRFI
jgi:hypothetical protein